MATTHSTKPSLGKLFISILKTGTLGLGGGANLILIQEQFVQKHKFCTPHEFQNALSLMWLLPGPTASELIAYLSYRTITQWWMPLVSVFLFWLPSSVIVLFLYYSQPYLNQAILNHLALTVTFCFMTSFCISSLSTHVKQNLTRTAPSVLIILASVVLAVALRPSLIQTTVIYVLGFLLWQATVHLRIRLHTIAFDPHLWIPLIKSSLLVYGGVYGTIPYLYDQWVTQYHLVPPDLYWTAVGIGMVTPGPMSVYLIYIGMTIGSMTEAYLMGLTFALLPALLIMPLVKLEKRLFQNTTLTTFLKYFFPFLITQILYFSITQSYQQTHSLWIVGIVIGMAALREKIKLSFFPYLVSAIGLGTLYHFTHT